MGLYEPLQVLKEPRGHWGGSEGHPEGHLLATTKQKFENGTKHYSHCPSKIMQTNWACIDHSLEQCHHPACNTKHDNL
jgi:hypothetical protein